MKKIFVTILSIIAISSFAQTIDEDTKPRFTFGLDVFADIWQDVQAVVQFFVVKHISRQKF